MIVQKYTDKFMSYLFLLNLYYTVNSVNKIVAAVATVSLLFDLYLNHIHLIPILQCALWNIIYTASCPYRMQLLGFFFWNKCFSFFLFFLKRIIHQVLAYALNFVWNCLCSSIFLCGNAKVKKFRYRKLFMEINENKNDQDLMNFSILLRLSFIACILDCFFAVFIYAYFGFSTIVLKTLTLITPCNLNFIVDSWLLKFQRK